MTQPGKDKLADKVCRNPNHTCPDGSAHPHEIGPSCMAEDKPAGAQERCPTCGSTDRAKKNCNWPFATGFHEVHKDCTPCRDPWHPRPIALPEFEVAFVPMNRKNIPGYGIVRNNRSIAFVSKNEGEAYKVAMRCLECECLGRGNAEAVPKETAAPTPDYPAILERERTLVAEGVTAVKKAIQSREWLTEGRGSYEWDDDRWHGEFAAAISEILTALEPLEKVAADWSNCPKTWDEVQKARASATAAAAPPTPDLSYLANLIEMSLCLKLPKGQANIAIAAVRAQWKVWEGREAASHPPRRTPAPTGPQGGHWVRPLNDKGDEAMPVWVPDGPQGGEEKS